MKYFNIALLILIISFCGAKRCLSQSTPVATTATLITTTSFFANWTGQSSSGFYVDVSTLNFFATYVTGYASLLVYPNGVYVTGLLPGKTYYYRVRNANSTTYSNTMSVTLLPDPALVAPVAATATNATSGSFTANWSSVPNISLYGVDVSTSNSFVSNVVTDRRSTSTNTTIAGLESNKMYYYRVRSINSNGSSPNSNVISVMTMIGAPVAPFVPTSVNIINPVSFTAIWGAVAGATEYRLDVSLSNTFAALLPGYNNLLVTATSQNVNGLLLNTPYYYRVRAAPMGHR